MRLSACFGWLLRTGKIHGLKANPCLRSSNVQRNPETQCAHCVTHDEFRDVQAMASPSKRLMIKLTNRTPQSSQNDILGWVSANLLVENDTCKLHRVQNKTKVKLRIALPESVIQPLVYRLAGERYTYGGLCSMLKRSISAANESRKAPGELPIASFVVQDLKLKGKGKGKGPTDMWLNGVTIERIHLLSSSSDGKRLSRTW